MPGACSFVPQEQAVELRRFVARFDRREYWLAHEELEALWLRDRRDVYKGLIHLAAACLHLERGNQNGAATKLRSGADSIRNDPEGIAGLDREGLLSAVEEIVGQIEAAGDLPAPLGSLADYFDFDRVEAVHDEAVPYRVRRYAQGYRTGRDPKRRD